MQIIINIKKKHLYFLSLIAAMIIIASVASAYGSSNPAVFGHTPGELDEGTFNGNYTFSDTVTVTNNINAARINTGLGNYEVNTIAQYAGNQNLRTSDSPTFDNPTVTTLNTGQGANELYAMNQNVRTFDNARFNTVRIVSSASAPISCTSGVAGSMYLDTQQPGRASTEEGLCICHDYSDGQGYKWRRSDSPPILCD